VFTIANIETLLPGLYTVAGVFTQALQGGTRPLFFTLLLGAPSPAGNPQNIRFPASALPGKN
jgi:hypothetical protein